MNFYIGVAAEKMIILLEGCGVHVYIFLNTGIRIEY